MAISLNDCSFIGHLIRDPEIRPNTSRFMIAVDDEFKDRASGERKDRTEFVPCYANDKLAEICNRDLKKGKRVMIKGKFRTKKYTPAGSTEPRYISEIEVTYMQMLDTRREAEQISPTHRPNVPPRQQTGGSRPSRPMPELHDDDAP